MERFRKQMLRNGVAYLFMAVLILLAGLFVSNPLGLPYPFPAQGGAYASDYYPGAVVGSMLL